MTDIDRTDGYLQIVREHEIKYFKRKGDLWWVQCLEDMTDDEFRKYFKMAHPFD